MSARRLPATASLRIRLPHGGPFRHSAELVSPKAVDYRLQRGFTRLLDDRRTAFFDNDAVSYPNRQARPQMACIRARAPHLSLNTSISGALSLGGRKLSTGGKPRYVLGDFLFFGPISRCDDSPTRACYICSATTGGPAG